MKTLLMLFTLFVSLVGTGCSVEMQQLDGQVSVAGNEPFTYVRILTADNRQYRLVGDQVETIRRQLQGRQVRLRGQVVKEALGPGMPAEFRVSEVQVLESRK